MAIDGNTFTVYDRIRYIVDVLVKRTQISFFFWKMYLSIDNVMFYEHRGTRFVRVDMTMLFVELYNERIKWRSTKTKWKEVLSTICIDNSGM